MCYYYNMDEKIYKYLKEQLSKYIPVDKVDDVLQTVLVEVYEKDVLPKDIVAYVLKACYQSYYSNTSPYSRQKFSYVELTDDIDKEDEQDEIIDIDKVIAWVESLDGLSWWEKQAFLRKILEEKTFQQLSKEYGIPTANVEYSFYKAKKLIQLKWQKRKNLQ